MHQHPDGFLDFHGFLFSMVELREDDVPGYPRSGLIL
jgi:hypothetical protein